MNIPTFFCSRTLLGFHPSQDLNRITLNGPDNFQFILYEMGEPRPADAADRCNGLAGRLTLLWDKDKAKE